MRRYFLFLFALSLVAVGGFSASRVSAMRIITFPATVERNLVLQGNAVLPQGAMSVVKNFAKIVAMKNLTIDGTLRCENSPLWLEVRGALIVRGTLECFRTTLRAKNDVGNGIMIAAKKVIFTDTAIVVTNGHVQLVDTSKKFMTTRKKINAYLARTAKDSGARFRVGTFLAATGVALGPIVPAQPKGGAATCTLDPLSRQGQNGPVRRIPGGIGVGPEAPPAGGVNPPPANAPAPLPPLPKGKGCVDRKGKPVKNCIQIGGTWVLGTGAVPSGKIVVPPPPKGVQRVILYYGFGNQQVILQDLEIMGPDALDGENNPPQGKEPKDCIVKGEDGHPALQLGAQAQKMKVNNFILRLGKGGRGGYATTAPCKKAIARAGEGGTSGNIKMEATKAFEIAGQFCIFPGDGGAGGNATATATDGASRVPDSSNPALCVGEDGGDATAVGGKGGDNMKALRVYGNVKGTNNIFIGPLVAGDGGNASATPGRGGDGYTTGGKRGRAGATGGKGGDARLLVPQFAGVKRVKDSVDRGGKGGSANGLPGSDATNGTGGTGVTDERHGADGASGGKPCGGEPTVPPSSDGTTNGNDGNTNVPQFRFVIPAGGLPFGQSFSLIVEGAGIEQKVPLEFVVRVGGKMQDLPSSTVKTAEGCSGMQCSVYIPQIKESWRGQTIEFVIYNENGGVVAQWSSAN